jgi:hypothetical protein
MLALGRLIQFVTDIHSDAKSHTSHEIRAVEGYLVLPARQLPVLQKMELVEI